MSRKRSLGASNGGDRGSKQRLGGRLVEHGVDGSGGHQEFENVDQARMRRILGHKMLDGVEFERARVENRCNVLLFVLCPSQLRFSRN